MDATQARKDAQKRREAIANQWKAIAAAHPLAIEDLMKYIDSQKEMFIHYAEERGMPGPDGQYYAIDNDTIAGLLQTSRGLGIVQVYIQNQIGSDVRTT